jgi:hypothetical protein
MIKLIQRYIMAYALFDFTFQIICQMPIFKFSPYMEIIGLRKVWVVEKGGSLSYSSLINHLDSEEQNYNGLILNKHNFYLQCINCVMISIISL